MAPPELAIARVAVQSTAVSAGRQNAVTSTVRAEPTANWSEYMLPRGRPFLLHYLRMVTSGSVFAIYHTESALTLLGLAGLFAFAAGVPPSLLLWTILPSAMIAGACLAYAGWYQARTTVACGIYTLQTTLSGRAYVRGDRRIAPDEELLDMHVGLDLLKAAFFERFDPTQQPNVPKADQARELYGVLLRENLRHLCEAFLGNAVFPADKIVRCRMYMHRRYVPWLDGTETGRCLLREGSAFNHSWPARALAKLIQWSAEGLRISQLRRNLIFKPWKLFKTFPTRTCIIMPDERLAFVERCIQNGYIEPHWQPAANTAFAAE